MTIPRPISKSRVSIRSMDESKTTQSLYSDTV